MVCPAATQQPARQDQISAADGSVALLPHKLLRLVAVSAVISCRCSGAQTHRHPSPGLCRRRWWATACWWPRTAPGTCQVGETSWLRVAAGLACKVGMRCHMRLFAAVPQRVSPCRTRPSPCSASRAGGELAHLQRQHLPPTQRGAGAAAAATAARRRGGAGKGSRLVVVWNACHCNSIGMLPWHVQPFQLLNLQMQRATLPARIQACLPFLPTRPAVLPAEHDHSGRPAGVQGQRRHVEGGGRHRGALD